MNPKTFLPRYFIILVSLLTLLLAASCAPASTTPTNTPQPGATQPPASQPTATKATGATQPQPTTAAQSVKLNSYRAKMTERANNSSGAITTEWSIEYVASPLASHTLYKQKEALESIVLGDKIWTRFGSQPWQQSTLSGDQSSLQPPSSTSGVNIQTQVPLEDSIEFLQGVPSFNIAKGSLTAAGDDTLNGVRCKRYKVNSTYPYSVTLMNMTSQNTEKFEGELCLADVKGWPHFIVMAKMQKSTTTALQGSQGVTQTNYVEVQVTDCNQPIKIEAPK